jgi:hypothetical protein
MRSILVVVSALIVSLTSASYRAGERSCHEDRNEYGQVVLVCESGGGSSQPTGGGNRPAEPYVTVVVTGLDDLGQQCAATASVPLSQAYGGGYTEAEVASISAGRSIELGRLGFVPCPGADPIVLTPEMWARAYLRALQLPVPAPRIDPGVMIVGLESFLETGSPVTQGLTEPATPFGPASFSFASTVTVAWGDGATSGPIASAGGPYPDGDLRHVYTSQGEYDIVVTQDWTATWQIGAESGTVTGLQTTGTLAGFPVQEREAVIVG